MHMYVFYSAAQNRISLQTNIITINTFDKINIKGKINMTKIEIESKNLKIL